VLQADVRPFNSGTTTKSGKKFVTAEMEGAGRAKLLELRKAATQVTP